MKDLKAEDKRAEVAADVEFYKALCAARGPWAATAIWPMPRRRWGVPREYTSNYHYLEACELAGNLLVANRKYPQAEPYYAELAKAPWEDYKMRAGVGSGPGQAGQGKTAEALKTFEDVLSNESTDDQAESQRLVAKLGKARCLAATARPTRPSSMAQEIIDKRTPKNNDLLTPRPTTPWAPPCARRGRTKEALLAFLHVDVLYGSSPETHAEALANLVELFTELHKSDHAGASLNKLSSITPTAPGPQEGEAVMGEPEA